MAASTRLFLRRKCLSARGARVSLPSEPASTAWGVGWGARNVTPTHLPKRARAPRGPGAVPRAYGRRSRSRPCAARGAEIIWGMVHVAPPRKLLAGPCGDDASRVVSSAAAQNKQQVCYWVPRNFPGSITNLAQASEPLSPTPCEAVCGQQLLGPLTICFACALGSLTICCPRLAQLPEGRHPQPQHSLLHFCRL